MSNKFENSSLLERKLNKKKEALYRQIQQDILEHHDYSLSLEMKTKIDDFAQAENLSSEEMSIYILERFNKEEGALADKLGELYIDLIYSSQNVKEKMTSGLDFYEAIAQLKTDATKKNIFLDQELINQRIKELATDLSQVEAA